MNTVHASRRGFLLGMSAAFGALALGVAPSSHAATDGTFVPSVWVKLDGSGTLHLTCNRSEMGQGIRSTIPMLLAAELGADLDRVEVVQAPGDEVYGDQNTDGSRSIRNQYEMLRRMAAVARTMLVQAASAELTVPERDLVVRDHAVHAPDGRSVGFGALAAGAAGLSVPNPDDVVLGEHAFPPSGADLPVVDLDAWVTGAARYGADVVLEGMRTAIIVRPPVLGSSVEGVDDAATRAMPGVEAVLKLPSWSAPAKFQPLGGVAVVAKDTWTAMEGAKALKISWSSSDHDGASWEADRASMEASVQGDGKVRRKVGDAVAALASAADVVEATYVLPHNAHAPIEPPAAVARVTDDGAEVWASTQTPQRARELVADALGLAKDKVTIHVTFLGAAFGRKSKPDYAVEAALLAKAFGHPVRVQWTRTDDLRHGYVHASSVQKLQGGFDERGELVAWRQRIAEPTIGSTFTALLNHLRDSEMGQGLSDVPLDIPHVQMETFAVQEHLRIGWLRSVYNINHAFSVQSFLDELANHRGMPTPAFVKKVLGPPRVWGEKELGNPVSNYGAPLEDHPVDVGRYHRVIDAVVERSGYPEAPEGQAMGFAVHRSFLTYVAVVVSVSKAADGSPKLEKAWVVADPGRIVHRDRVRAQLEGAVVFGLAVALHQQLTLKDGVVQQSNYWDHRIPRMHETPHEIDVHVITEGEAPGGVGEPGVPPVAPAIANAWFALTGERVRQLPFRPAPVRGEVG